MNMSHPMKKQAENSLHHDSAVDTNNDNIADPHCCKTKCLGDCERFLPLLRRELFGNSCLMPSISLHLLQLKNGLFQTLILLLQS